MTGRDLILYILKNNLEDDPVYHDGKLIGFLTVEEAAVRFDVGTLTIRVWCQFGKLHSINIFGRDYIPIDEALTKLTEQMKQERSNDYEE